MRFQILLLTLVSGSLFTACNRHNFTECPPTEEILQVFETPDGRTAMIAEDGSAFEIIKGRCEFLNFYFDPDFLNQHYLITDSTVDIRVESGGFFPTKNRFIEDFEGYTSFRAMFPSTIADTHLIWTAFTAQSPDNPTVQDYVALRQCILGGTCNFTDNRLELASDPTNPANTVLKCTAVAPTKKMVTSKASLETERPFFRNGDDEWYQARYFLQSGIPYSLVDFENPYFLESPGPRIYLQELIPGFENKFGPKLKYLSNGSVTVPQNQWFTLKTHIHYSHLDNGYYEIWLNGTLVLSTSCISLPLANSVQASLEIGISAAQEDVVLLVDDVQLSDQPF